jgi:hypothetical protein
VSTFLEVFFAFISGGITLWGLLQVEKYLKRRRDEPAGERTAHEFLKAQATQLQQAAARLSKPHVAPPATFSPPPHPTTGWGNWPPPVPGPAWPYSPGRHEETAAMPPAHPPIDPKAH